MLCNINITVTLTWRMYLTGVSFKNTHLAFLGNIYPHVYSDIRIWPSVYSQVISSVQSNV